MTNSRSGAQPAPRSSGGFTVGKAIAVAAAIAIAIVAVLAFMTRGGGEDTSAPDTGIVKELKAEKYEKVKDEKHNSAEAGREVVTEYWERAAAPEKIVITDDSPYTTKGTLIVNAVTYTGADGNGNLTCQPDPEHSRSDLKLIIENSNAVREGIKSGAIKPDPDDPAGFPYKGEYVGCMP